MDRKIAEKRANLVVNSIFKYVADIDEVKGIGFCVSIEHAEFMSEFFNERGIPSMYLTGKSPDEERKTAKDRLVKGEVRFIFVVYIYNDVWILSLIQLTIMCSAYKAHNKVVF